MHENLARIQTQESTTVKKSNKKFQLKSAAALKGHVAGRKLNGEFWPVTHSALEAGKTVCGVSLTNVKTLTRLQTNWVKVTSAVTCNVCLKASKPVTKKVASKKTSSKKPVTKKSASIGTGAMSIQPVQEPVAQVA